MTSLSAAKMRLASPPEGKEVFPLADLPRDPNQLDWKDIKIDYGLSLPELTALKNYAAQAAPAAQQQILFDKVQDGEYFANIEEIWPEPPFRTLGPWDICRNKVCRLQSPTFERASLKGDRRSPYEFQEGRAGALNGGTKVGESITTVNDELFPTDIFGKQITATDKAHLLPKARNDAKTWTYPGCAVLGISLDPMDQNVAEKAVLGCADATKSYPGIRNFLCNIVRMSNQGPCFDFNPECMILPILDLGLAKTWNGTAYDAIVVCASGITAVRIGLTAVNLRKAQTATLKEINTAATFAAELCEFLAQSVLHKDADEVRAYQAVGEIFKLNTFFAMESHQIQIPYNLASLPEKKVFKISFSEHANFDPSDGGHPAPDPMLLGFKTNNNWCRLHAGFRMVGGAEPEDLDELSEDGRKHLQACIDQVGREEKELRDSEILNPSGLEGGYRTVAY